MKIGSMPRSPDHEDVACGYLHSIEGSAVIYRQVLELASSTTRPWHGVDPQTLAFWKTLGVSGIWVSHLEE